MLIVMFLDKFEIVMEKERRELKILFGGGMELIVFDWKFENYVFKDDNVRVYCISFLRIICIEME